MPKDEAEAIHQLARKLLEDDVSCETRCRLARKIIEHAKSIKAACMAEPDNIIWGEPVLVWESKSTHVPPNYG